MFTYILTFSVIVVKIQIEMQLEHKFSFWLKNQNILYMQISSFSSKYVVGSP